jgi:DNA invertase Pin-like site-specific DNA recombinase
MFYRAQVPESPQKRTAIYARTSWNGRNTESQLDACRRTAESLDFDVTREFIDENVSGSIAISSRPGSLELISSLRDLDVLIVYRLDRLSRSVVGLTDVLRDLAIAGVEVWSVADLPIPARIVTDKIAEIAAFAESERSAIGQRMGNAPSSRKREVDPRTSAVWLRPRPVWRLNPISPRRGGHDGSRARALDIRAACRWVVNDQGSETSK